MSIESGLFYEIPVAGPRTAHAERDALHAVVAQAARGEEVGFTHVWTVEHHFLETSCTAPRSRSSTAPLLRAPFPARKNLGEMTIKGFRRPLMLHRVLRVRP